MSDLIKREDAIKAIHNYWKKRLDTLPTKESEYGEVCADIQQMDKILEHNKALCNFIKAIPSARPQWEWIPCSKRLPESQGYYICTCKDGSKYKRATAVKWSNGWQLTGARAYWVVLAWMPFPEPWKGADGKEQSDDQCRLYSQNER